MQLGLREVIPAMNLYGYQGADGSWQALGTDGPYAGAYEEGALICYWEFGSHVG